MGRIFAMKTISKLTLVGIALTAGAAAHADTIVNTGANPSTGSSLVLFVKDTTAGHTSFYVEDLGLTMQGLQDRGTVAGDPAYNLDGISANGPLNSIASLDRTSANLASFFSARAGDTFSWSIIGTDTSGGTQDPGNERIAFTSLNNQLNVGWDGTAVDAAAQSADQFFLGDINNNTFVNGVSSTNGYGDTTVFGAGAPGTWVGVANGGDVGSVAQTLYLLATRGYSTAANVYQAAAQLRLTTSGHLEVLGATGPEVPLPAAVWLLGSGLLGLVGVGRRRRAAEVAA
jgi:hypothetical protein